MLNTEFGDLCFFQRGYATEILASVDSGKGDVSVIVGGETFVVGPEDCPALRGGGMLPLTDHGATFVSFVDTQGHMLLHGPSILVDKVEALCEVPPLKFPKFYL
ncbi:hypothetical protein A2160_06170 [Candidatus Beckwithbacteria bacterium RBG_13_42_9]|uniref:Uncharacterized protein n=1 Tax=Candidatus Beckwithbacteria bacterium RBG_13_42_9 TaxID=1797457 RepID=A0A1F5E5K4_9BACT|nr:MAG: hypothetical protein A2160_06170 [Candidatus Beckwithbacteria bacterium RBG_13_42_9]